MTIRGRLTLWYTGVLLASILLMAAVMYYELVIERRADDEAGIPKEPMEEEIIEVILFYGLPTALLTASGGWWLLRRALAPLDELTRASQNMQVHNLKVPLPRTGNGDEVDRLSEVLNTTNARLEQSFQQIREFTLHASHELRTPLAILHGEIETALADPEATAVQQETYASQLDEVQRLGKIVESLTLLARADAGQISLASDVVNLDGLVQDNFADIKILAQQEDVKVELIACEAIQIVGDRHRLRQLLLNLGENAIKYNKSGGHIHIALQREDDRAVLRLSNTGRGIPPHLLPKVFDRFFRVDPSHNRTVDGCGLGLALAKWIVEAHQGSIEIRSEVGGLTTVEVSIPTLSTVSKTDSAITG